MLMLFMCEVLSDLYQMIEIDIMVMKVGMFFFRIIVC